EEDEETFLAEVSCIAQHTNTYHAVAYLRLPLANPAVGGQNKSVLVDPAGQARWHYLKAHPVPGSTDKKGDGVLPVIQTPYGNWSAAICYDMDFTPLIRQAGRQGVDIMTVPAWDWRAIDPLHARMASFRAIENGFSMLRQTGMGRSLAVDPYGRVLSSMSYFDPGDQVMHAQLPLESVRTVYALLGDWFAWLCGAPLLWVLASGIRSDARDHG
ncbi:MAG: nitrilase-related carbon-nitrogen hydrolase, partial [Saprospiraceae bacterium]|nr:nitrilase-related carbon-nitrogen hydrolase [Saprospiraceae bacterium]